MASSNMKNWVRGSLLGSGSGGNVYMATPTEGCTKLPSPTAVKSSPFVTSPSLAHEEDVLSHFQSCPHIIHCYGHDHTWENGQKFFHIFLEYASGGSLADHLRKHGGKFCEPSVRQYTRSILEGLKEVHDNGFVHCDIKLQNILVFDNGNIKIADFGLAKKIGEKNDQYMCRGTPMFLSPEAINDNEYEPPADIWALGCAVIEMVTGKHAWTVGTWDNTFTMMIRIGSSNETPEVPPELSNEGKDFLQKCFVKDPNHRWSADMLLNHPFVLNIHQHTPPSSVLYTATPPARVERRIKKIRIARRLVFHGKNVFQTMLARSMDT